MATRIIAVLNQKGGVGKTTTCVNLGAALALRGQQVLLIDMDPQANMSVHLGLDPQHAQATSYSVLLGETTLPESMVQTSTPGLRMVPSTLALANAEIQLASAVGRELILTEQIQGWLHPEPDLIPDPLRTKPPVTAPPADFVLIDCPPSLGILTMNALCAATDVLLPIQTEFFALQGVRGILESLKAVQRLNKSLRLSIVLPSMVDYRTNLAKDVIEEVRKYFGHLVARSVIRTNVKLAEAPSYGQTIFEYDKSSRGAKDYAALADEILGIEPEDESGAGSGSAPKSTRDSTPPVVTDAAPSDNTTTDIGPESSTGEPPAAEPSSDQPAAVVAAPEVARAAPAPDDGPTAEPAAIARVEQPPPQEPSAPHDQPTAQEQPEPVRTEIETAAVQPPPLPAEPPAPADPTHVPAHVIASEPVATDTGSQQASDSDFARALEVTTAVEEAVTQVSLPVRSPPPATEPSPWQVAETITPPAIQPIDIDEIREPVALQPISEEPIVDEPAPQEAPVATWSPERRPETRIGLPDDPVDVPEPQPAPETKAPASGTPLGYSATVHSISPPPAPARNRIDEHVRKDDERPYGTNEYDTGELDTASIETAETDSTHRD